MAKSQDKRYSNLMRLSHFLNNISILSEHADCEIKRLCLDSRQIQLQDLFLAIKGTQLDGRQYIADAIKRGAAAVLVDTENMNTIAYERNVPLIPVPHLREKISLLAARFYDFPAKKLRMIGVTGTNGKTSCTHFIAQVLQSLNIPCGIMGTLGYGFYGALSEVGLTTPDAITLQKTIHHLLQQEAKAIAMEVSSHSIDQGRVNDLDFEIGVFTNLSQDHLDYHGDMETYAAVKRRFIAEMTTKNVIINADDFYGQKWLRELAHQKTVFTYSANGQKNAMIYASQVQLTSQGICAHILSPWGEGELSLRLMGQFNLSNALATLTALCVYGIPFTEAIQQLAKINSVPGRMQKIMRPGKPLVVVDYSHTPDSLEKALQALRGHTKGQLICVFGCGGDRDQGKRPIMGKIAEAWADQSIITNDNPRHENPEKIAEQILQGLTYPERALVILDRSKAIEKSIQWAKREDCILIAGKGAEHYQQIGDQKIPFDDVLKASEFLDRE